MKDTPTAFQNHQTGLFFNQVENVEALRPYASKMSVLNVGSFIWIIVQHEVPANIIGLLQEAGWTVVMALPNHEKWEFVVK